MVELALALPIFFLIIFGLIDLGRAVYTYNTLSEGAAKALGTDRSRRAPSTTRPATGSRRTSISLLEAVTQSNGHCELHAVGGLSTAARSTTSWSSRPRPTFR